MISSFYQYAKDYPPILVRLLARHRNGPPLTTVEIVNGCAEEGYPMSAYKIGIISMGLDWEDIPFGEMRAFTASCGMNFCDPEAMNRKRVYLKQQHKFKYLQRSPEWETILKPLVIRYRQHIAKEIRK